MTPEEEVALQEAKLAILKKRTAPKQMFQKCKNSKCRMVLPEPSQEEVACAKCIAAKVTCIRCGDKSGEFYCPECESSGVVTCGFCARPPRLGANTCAHCVGAGASAFRNAEFEGTGVPDGAGTFNGVPLSESAKMTHEQRLSALRPSGSWGGGAVQVGVPTSTMTARSV